jgi:hypothetical protein
MTDLEMCLSDYVSRSTYGLAVSLARLNPMLERVELEEYPIGWRAMVDTGRGVFLSWGKTPLGALVTLLNYDALLEVLHTQP